MGSGIGESGFFERVYEVATSPVDMVEGSLWGLWFGYQVYQLRSNFQEKANAHALSDSHPEKAIRIWNAEKAIFLKSAMTISAGAFVADWLGQVGLLQFGILQPLVASLGFLGTAICSPFYLWDTLKEVYQGTIDHANATTFAERQNISLRQFDRLLGIAMLVCFIGWGVLGFAHAFVGGAELFQIVDSCFFFGGVLFLCRLGYAIFFLPPRKKEDSPALS